MWSTRIVESVRRAGGSAIVLGTQADLAIALKAHEIGDQPAISGAIVDLALRGFDGATAIGDVHVARLPVVAVAEHDDQLTRKRALAAGASRVFSYRKFFEDGTRLVQKWLEANAPPEP